MARAMRSMSRQVTRPSPVTSAQGRDGDGRGVGVSVGVFVGFAVFVGAGLLVEVGAMAVAEAPGGGNVAG